MIFITKTQLKTHCPVPLSRFMRRWCLGGDDFLRRRLWLTDCQCILVSLFLLCTHGEGSLISSLLILSFLMQPGLSGDLLCHTRGHFYLCSNMSLFVGLLRVWVACPCVHRALTIEGFRRLLIPTSFGAAPLLITIWEKPSWWWNWKGGGGWLSPTFSLFSWRKTGPERGCVPCPGHGTICGLFSSPVCVL